MRLLPLVDFNIMVLYYAWSSILHILPCQMYMTGLRICGMEITITEIPITWLLGPNWNQGCLLSNPSGWTRNGCVLEPRAAPWLILMVRWGTTLGPSLRPALPCAQSQGLGRDGHLLHRLAPSGQLKALWSRSAPHKLQTLGSDSPANLLSGTCKLTQQSLVGYYSIGL